MARYAVVRRFALLCLLVMPVAAYADLHSDMVKFDQEYIPALLLSGQNKSLTAPAMVKLLNRWEWFKQRQAYRADRDAQWNFDLTDVEHSLLSAKRLVDEGDYGDAHVALEGIRTTFMQMRKRSGMVYLPDALLDFHDVMETLLALVGEAEGPANTDALHYYHARALARWQAVLDWPINPYDYGLDSRGGELLRRQMLDESRLLKRFGQLLAAGDRAGLSTTASDIKTCFVHVYSNFGHFPQAPATASVH